MGSKDWNAAIDALLALRGKDINFHVVDVDGMLFIALRNRGYQKITQADLESGIYDLSLASNFGPLDSEAEGLMSWSQMYITGASFWGIDWQQVIDYFVQVAPQMPNLMDNSGLTATERLRQAYFEYGNQLASQGQACKALELYQQSLAIAPNSEVETAMNTVAKQCGGGEAQGTPGDPQKTPKTNKTPTP
jgi:tetratricopeptide (TPR) repeat protein